MKLRKSDVLLVLLLIACRGPKVMPVNHCEEACSPDPSITLEQLERGACFPGRWDCSIDGGTCVGAVLPVPEQCGTKDLDCNGWPGDVPDRPCYNICGALTTQSCVNGQWETCRTYMEEFTNPEVCNGRDDNCNGQIDEGLAATPCYTGDPNELYGPNTACRYGTQFCSNGVLGQCIGETLPSPEICGDGIDNNCDGVTDEGCNLVFQLEWDYFNKDLDLHVGIPAEDGGTYGWFAIPKTDCYYANCTPGTVAYNPVWDDGGVNNPHLNHDDIYGTGPEITTVSLPVDTHPYEVAVHWYDLPMEPDSNFPTATLTILCDRRVIYSGQHQFTTAKDAWFVGKVFTHTDAGLSCVFVSDGTVIGGLP